MTGKVVDSGSSGVLILILPLAVAVVFLYSFWPLLLAIAIFSLAWKIWQNYQWQQTCIKVNPYFNQLLRENQGCLTPVDLSLKANLSGGKAKAFLDRKAEEYGGQREIVQDKGLVYYFITATSLGSIFDDSDFLVKASEEKAISQPQAKHQLPAGTPFSIEQPKVEKPEIEQPELISTSARSKQSSFDPSGSDRDLQKETKAPEKAVAETKVPVPIPEINVAPQEEKLKTETKEQKTETAKSNAAKSKTYEPLIQSDLAKRLEINPSTIGRKKSDPDFPQWSQSRDPEGVAWQYLAETRMFSPVDGA